MFRILPYFGGDPRTVAEIVNGIMNGKTNNVGIVTLATGGATTTTITDRRIGADSILLLTPLTAAANTDSVPYGAFQDSTDQTIASTTTAYEMTFNTTDSSNGVTVVTSGAKASRLTVANAGTYNLQWSGQFQNTDTQLHDVSVWLRKNGTDIAGSSGVISVPNSHGGVDGHTLVGWNYFVDLAANDYIEMMWSATNTAVSLQFYAAGTAPTRPSTASLIATLSYVNTSSSFNVYVSARGKGTATLTHFANSTADKTFGYVIVG
jgi:hypothetical protein